MALLDNESETPLLGFLDYLRIIRERWLLGLALGILLSGLWTLYQFSRTPLYTSSVQMMVELLNENIVDIQKVVDESDMLNRSRQAESLLNQHLVQLNSQSFRQYMIDSMSVARRNRIADPYRTKDKPEPNLAEILYRVVEFDIEPDALIYVVKATHPRPQDAKFIADRYAQQYVRFITSELGTSNDAAIAFLQTKVRDLEAVILKEENKLQKFRQENRIVSIEASRQLALTQLQQYQTEQTRLTVELQVQKALTDQIESSRDNLAALMNISEIANFRNVAAYQNQLDLAKAERERLSIDFLERHPAMVENQAAIDKFEELLKLEIGFAVESIEVTLARINTQFRSNEERMDATQEKIQRLEELAIEYDVIVRNIAGLKDTLLDVSNRLNDTQISAQLSNANMMVIDSATLPRKPTTPNLVKTAMAACVLFGIGFIGLPIGMHFIDNKLKTPYDIETFIEKPLLGEIFKFSKKQQRNVGRLVADAEDELLVDTFRSVYNTIRLNEHSNGGKKIQVITSTIPAEGKTMFSMNYSTIVSQHGARTLLIDCDLRKPRIERYMRLDIKLGLVRWYHSNEPVPNGNLMESMLGIIEVSENFHLLPAGKPSNQSTEMVESERFKALLDKLIEEYDHIVIDTPPIGVFPDAMFLANYAQDVIYVGSFNRVPRQTVKYFVQELDKTKADVCGLVLNGRPSSKSGGAYGQNYGYNYKYASKYYGKYYKSTVKS